MIQYAYVLLLWNTTDILYPSFIEHTKTITINVLYKSMYNTDNYRFKLCCHLLAIYHVLPPDSAVTYFRWERQWTVGHAVHSTVHS